MRVGVIIPPTADPAGVVDTAVRAEELGFDYLACGEHVFFHGPMQNAFVTLAAAAAVTSRIRLLSALTVLPLYPAALAAKQASILDRISHGRFDLGVGVGGEFPPEFDAVGVPVRGRGRRTDEALDLLRALFAGGPVDFTGENARVAGLRLDPPPMQPGGPPIWVGGRKEAALRRTVRYGDVWFPYVVSPEQLAAGLARLRELHDELEVDRVLPRGAFFGWGAVDESSARARGMAVSVVSETYQQDFAPLADRYLVAGSPAQVVDRLGMYAEHGASDFIFAPAAADAQSLRHMVDLFADQVLPHIRSDEPIGPPADKDAS
ncbi:LLM class flavin-dependent oxidoreductase [Nocardioides sp. LHG3406-4]|uniref:LLM class flavin-dependent oxidoreductase n=1 Tax=Nocardioides sp. LHG3406-4 TaxID=2804575 RepID=UPI003CEEBD4B